MSLRLNSGTATPQQPLGRRRKPVKLLPGKYRVSKKGLGFLELTLVPTFYYLSKCFLGLPQIMESEQYSDEIIFNNKKHAFDCLQTTQITWDEYARSNLCME